MYNFPDYQPEIFSTPLKGTVTKAIALNAPGRVKCMASYWPAKIYQVDRPVTLKPDQLVSVIGRQGLTLLVRPLYSG